MYIHKLIMYLFLLIWNTILGVTTEFVGEYFHKCDPEFPVEGCMQKWID